MFEITKCLKTHEKLSNKQCDLKEKLYSSVSPLSQEEQQILIEEIDWLDNKMQQIENKTFVCEIETLRECVVKTLQRKGYFDNLVFEDNELQYYKNVMAKHIIRKMYMIDDEFCKKQIENFGDSGELELRVGLILDSSIMLESVLLMEKFTAKKKHLKDKYGIDI